MGGELHEEEILVHPTLLHLVVPRGHHVEDMMDVFGAHCALTGDHYLEKFKEPFLSALRSDQISHF